MKIFELNKSNTTTWFSNGIWDVSFQSGGVDCFEAKYLGVNQYIIKELKTGESISSNAEQVPCNTFIRKGTNNDDVFYKNEKELFRLRFFMPFSSEILTPDEVHELNMTKKYSLINNCYSVDGLFEFTLASFGDKSHLKVFSDDKNVIWIALGVSYQIWHSRHND